MIDFDRIENVPFIFLRGNGYSEQHLKSYLDFPPHGYLRITLIFSQTCLKRAFTVWNSSRRPLH